MYCTMVKGQRGSSHNVYRRRKEESFEEWEERGENVCGCLEMRKWQQKWIFGWREGASSG
jgi:hypothetical protein